MTGHFLHRVPAIATVLAGLSVACTTAACMEPSPQDAPDPTPPAQADPTPPYTPPSAPAAAERRGERESMVERQIARKERPCRRAQQRSA